MGRTLQILGLVTLVLFAVAIPANAEIIPGTGPYTISQINDDLGGKLVVGDKTFSEFFVSTTSTHDDQTPGADTTNITGVYDEATNEYGILVTAGWSAQTGEFVDTALIYKVEAARPFLISDMRLSISGFQASNGAEASVSEQLYSSPPPFLDPNYLLASLAVRYFGESDNRNVLADHEEFEPLKAVWVFKDVLVKGGQNPDGFVQLSGVFQTFRHMR